MEHEDDEDIHTYVAGLKNPSNVGEMALLVYTEVIFS